MASKHIPPDLHGFVDGLLSSGRYELESDVIRESLELLKDQEYARERRRAEIFAKIDEAIADVDENGGIPAEEVFAELDAIIERAAAARDAAE
jgi:putative addiction module CopG family antidote